MRHKFCKFSENRGRDTPLWGVYIPNFGKISVKISVLGSSSFIAALMWVKFGMKEWTFAVQKLYKSNKFFQSYDHKCNLGSTV